MSDLIKREDAIEVIDTMICDNKWVCECAINSLPSEDVVRIEVYKELYEKYVELKHELEQPQNDNWIPVSERLPSEVDLYLVSLGEEVVETMGWNGEEFVKRGKKWSFDFITAWQPLPTPYKGE